MQRQSCVIIFTKIIASEKKIEVFGHFHADYEDEALQSQDFCRLMETHVINEQIMLNFGLPKPLGQIILGADLINP